MKIYPKKSQDELPENFEYPPSEDIYNQSKEIPDIDPEDLLEKKEKNTNPDDWNEKDWKQDETGEDLDVPGAELDDEEEKIGAEDEENNYYSIGGDNHNNLEENDAETDNT